MKAWKTVLLYLFSALLLLLFFRQVDVKAASRTFSRVGALYVLAFALGVLANILIRAVRWRVLIEPFKPAVSLRSLYNFTAIGYLVSYSLPGRLGEIARPLLLAEKEGISKSSVLATVICERFIDTVCVLLLFIAALALHPGAGSLVRARFLHIAIGALALGAVLLAILILLASRPGRPYAEKISGGLARLLPARLRPGLAAAIRNFLSALDPRFTRRRAGRYAAWTVLLLATVIASYWLLARGMPGMRLGFFQAVLFFSFIYVASAVPLPGLAGSLDWAARFALTVFLSVPAGSAVTYTILFHFLLVALTFFLGIVALHQEGLRLSRIRLLGKSHEMS